MILHLLILHASVGTQEKCKRYSVTCKSVAETETEGDSTPKTEHNKNRKSKQHGNLIEQPAAYITNTLIHRTIVVYVNTSPHVKHEYTM